MSNDLWWIMLVVVIGAHSLGHGLFLVSCLGLADWGQSTCSWLLTSLAGDRVTCAIGNLLWLVAIAGFMAAAVGSLGE